jgi:hypothetical protein
MIKGIGKWIFLLSIGSQWRSGYSFARRFS